jgi:AcrR family transcriptional regulator
VSERAESRKRLLETAREHFLEHSYHRATLRQIARDANVTTGSLYHHFSGKDELFVEVCAEGMRRMLERLRATARLTEGSAVADRLLAIFDAYVTFFLEERGYFDLIAYLQASPEQLNIGPQLAQRVDELSTRFLDEMAGILGRQPHLDEAEAKKRVLFAVALAEGLVACERRALLSSFGLSLGAFRGMIRQMAERVVLGELG